MFTTFILTCGNLINSKKVNINMTKMYNDFSTDSDNSQILMMYSQVHDLT